jgi:hypothetical protein
MLVFVTIVTDEAGTILKMPSDGLSTRPDTTKSHVFIMTDFWQFRLNVFISNIFLRSVSSKTSRDFGLKRISILLHTKFILTNLNNSVITASF